MLLETATIISWAAYVWEKILEKFLEKGTENILSNIEKNNKLEKFDKIELQNIYSWFLQLNNSDVLWLKEYSDKNQNMISYLWADKYIDFVNIMNEFQKQMIMAINHHQQNNVNLIIKLRNYEVNSDDGYNYLVNNSKTLLSTYKQLKKQVEYELYNKYYHFLLQSYNENIDFWFIENDWSNYDIISKENNPDEILNYIKWDIDWDLHFEQAIVWINEELWNKFFWNIDLF